MVSGDSRRIVVIKDIRSNYIEEAILILKNEPGTRSDKRIPGKQNENRKINTDYLLKEAEFIINNYMKENKLQPIPGKSLERRLNEGRRGFMINFAINAALVTSVALLIFLIVKIF